MELLHLNMSDAVMLKARLAQYLGGKKTLPFLLITYIIKGLVYKCSM